MEATQSQTQNSPPIRADLTTLFQSIETRFSSTNLGDRWYLLVLSALVGGTEPELSSHLYLYLLQQPSYQTSSSRQALTRRLRETLIKLISLIGVCKPIEAILSISKVESPCDRDYSFSRQNWQCDTANHARGMAWMRAIYQGDLERTLGLFEAHRDFAWVSTEITYGLYLADRSVLDDWDTEVVVLVGIMVQNLRLETEWHVRGARRIGMSEGDVGVIVECTKMVMGFMGVRMDRLPGLEEVEVDV
ncbi:hypothetical protein M011DRAFT_518903 [Sporormia fimetaria CBS 119925]|uniref:Carboxymuconolactone decarboxylase-like domain-containing protein n=1 Tax=Sporormia fimetaria CBS 119925 TaxID=1340428 RepID=A0A6A6VEZ3_9PLEO|nr:hypothetical protein M011DRAFT_518903 [Sporormia fimetaria CBS 119925]